MIVFLALLDIFCLVVNTFVGKTINKPENSEGGDSNGLFLLLFKQRYESIHIIDYGKLIWSLLGLGLFLLSWLLFGISFAFDPELYQANSAIYSSGERGFIVWKFFIAVVLTLNIVYVVHSHILTSRQRPIHLGITALSSLITANLILFIYGAVNLAKLDVSPNIPFVILLSIQFFDAAIYIIVIMVLMITYWLGRQGHGGSSDALEEVGDEGDDKEVNKKRSKDSRAIETSESNAFHIDFIDFSVASGGKLRYDAEVLQIKTRGGILISNASKIGIGMSVLPGRRRGRVQRDVNIDLDRVRQHFSIDTVVSLMPYEQLEEMMVPNLQRAVESHGMLSILSGWRDKWIPSFSSLDHTIELVHRVVEKITLGDRVLIHCMGGKGRTGLVAVCVLINLGYSLPEAIGIVRRSRSGCIHNPLQLYYLNWFSNYYNQARRNNSYRGNELDRPIAANSV